MGFETDLETYPSRDVPEDQDAFKHPALVAEMAENKIQAKFQEKFQKVAGRVHLNIKVEEAYQGNEWSIVDWANAPGSEETEKALELLAELRPEVDEMLKLNEALDRPFAVLPTEPTV